MNGLVKIGNPWKNPAKCVSGGIVIFVKNWVLHKHYQSVIEYDFDGIYGILLQHKTSGRETIIIVCYLPPEGSEHCHDDRAFYDYLKTVIYWHSDSDICVIGGDVNGMIGNKQDAVSEIDAVCKRHPLDLEKNKHGDALIEFLIDSKYCIVNGRVTAVSTKGKLVVDYLLTKFENVNYFQTCRVHTIKELCDLIGIATKHKLPYHSVITAELSLTYHVSDYNAMLASDIQNGSACIW